MSIAEPIVTRRSWPRRVLRGLRRLVLAAVALALVALLGGTIYVLTLPSVGDAQTRADQIIASHHEGTAMPVPAKLAAAAIATEDEHFDDNVVFNVATGAGRAAIDVLSGGSNPGGATIDQQLAKQRQQHVLAQLVANGKLTQRQAISAYRARLPLR